MKKLLLVNIGVVIIFSLSFIACQKVNELVDKYKNDKEDEGIVFYALAGKTLVQYSTANPEKIINSSTITGLQEGETIVGIDFRPATGEFYALGSKSRLYVIDFNSGLANFVAALTTIPMGSTTAVPLALSGTSFGVDFNPVVDRIRIISNTGQNLRAHPTTGVTLVDGPINPQPASVNGVAYDNNDTDTTTTTELFALDVSGDKIFEIDPPNNGTLIDPLSIKLNITGDGGFDIAPRNAKVTTDIGLGLYEIDKTSTLFRIDVETGETKILAKYYKDAYTAIAISPVR
ncbi:MAG: DUF4394 domain-containing protein [Chitinophagaceae bacterium]|nr:DUF4394 domain-containing protein [Chitinophagaceae bacterium]